MPYVRSLTAVCLIAILGLGSCATHRVAQKRENDTVENPSSAIDTSRAAMFRQGLKSSLREKVVPSMKAKIDSTEKD